jgi:hypothetical protein
MARMTALRPAASTSSTSSRKVALGSFATAFSSVTDTCMPHAMWCNTIYYQLNDPSIYVLEFDIMHYGA